jgi:hypothetical protein
MSCHDEEVDDRRGILVGCCEFSVIILVKNYLNVDDILFLPLNVLIALIAASSEGNVEAQAKAVLSPSLLAIFFMLSCAWMKCPLCW